MTDYDKKCAETNYNILSLTFECDHLAFLKLFVFSLAHFLQ